jgi:hypothetical protein
MLGPLAELGAFQRLRVRRTAAAVAAMAAVCIVFVLLSVAMNGVGITFGPDTPVRLPILALIAALLLAPIVWSAVFRSRRYGVTLTRDVLIVVSWWRTRRFERSALSSAESGPAVMRISDGFFSGSGTDAAPCAVWLTPSEPGRAAFPLGVTTGTESATRAASRRINAWLSVEVDANGT